MALADPVSFGRCAATLAPAAMADLFTITAPLTIRPPGGDRKVMAHWFRHPEGLVYFDLYWHDGDPDETIRLVRGAVRGDGPWKVGDHVVQVLGCHGSDPELAVTYQQWQSYLGAPGTDYPPPPLIAAIARRMGCDPGQA